MKAASLTLQAPVAQGRHQCSATRAGDRGVVTGFERLSTSVDETHYALTLQPARRCLTARTRTPFTRPVRSADCGKILRERHGLRGQDFLFSLTKTYPRREQVMQYGEDDLRFITRLLRWGSGFGLPPTRGCIDVAEFCDSQQAMRRG